MGINHEKYQISPPGNGQVSGYKLKRENFTGAAEVIMERKKNQKNKK